MKKLLSIVVSFMLVLPVGLMAQDEAVKPESGDAQKKIEEPKVIKKDKKHANKKKHAKKHHNKKKHNSKKHNGNKKEQHKKPEVKENNEEVK